MRRLPFAVVVTGVSVAVAAVGIPNGAGVGVPAGEVVFSRSPDVYRDRGSDLYLARPDGSHLRLLVRNGADPAASPDGRLITFERNGAIWVMNRDTSGQHVVSKRVARQLPKGRYPAIWDYGPTWSAHGRTIYFTRDVAKTDIASLYRVDPDGTALRRLTFPKPTDDGHCHDGPSASPNGRFIAFADWGACRHGTFSRIDAITTTGRPAGLPFRFPRRYYDVLADPAWAPDGQFLAYMTMDLEGGSGEAIWVSSAGGSPARLAVNKNYSVGSPAWSPDSEWILFAREDSGNYDIWRVRRDGSALQRLTNGPADDSEPAWLPPAR